MLYSQINQRNVCRVSATTLRSLGHPFLCPAWLYASNSCQHFYQSFSCRFLNIICQAHFSEVIPVRLWCKPVYVDTHNHTECMLDTQPCYLSVCWTMVSSTSSCTSRQLPVSSEPVYYSLNDPRSKNFFVFNNFCFCVEAELTRELTRGHTPLIHMSVRELLIFLPLLQTIYGTAFPLKTDPKYSWPAAIICQGFATWWVLPYINTFHSIILINTPY